MKNISSKLFIGILLIISFLFLFKLALNSNEYNFIDNRMSYKFKMPTIKTIMDTSYQDDFEKAISDQLPKYNIFKLAYLKVANYVNILSIRLFNLDKQNRYLNFGDINLYNDYLLYNPTNLDDIKNVSSEDITKINEIIANTNANIYLYYIDTDFNHNFEKDSYIDAYSYLSNNLNIDKDKIAYFKIASFDKYKEYFYRSDHHWNHHGSYKGYTDIAKLMHYDNIITYNNEYCFDGISSYGSKSKKLAGIKLLNETMCIYEYNYQTYEISTKDEKLADYGTSIQELKTLNELSYAGIYGGDYGELIIKNKDNFNNKNLLVYSNSYSNAINKLLAANYQNTYIIDGRYYKDKTMIEYINDNNIDDVLILSNAMLFWDDIEW